MQNNSQIVEEKGDSSAQNDREEIESQEVMYQGDMFVAQEEQVIEMPQTAEAPFYVPDFIAQINMSSINRDHTTCQICGDDLTNKRFYNHLFDHHGFTKQQIEALKQQKRLESFNSRLPVKNGRKNQKKTHECGVCGLEFVTKSGLTSHLSKAMSCSMQDEQEGGKTSIHKIVCPSYACEKNVATYLDLAIHVDTEHRELSTLTDSFRIRRVTFPDKNSFMKWKRHMETESCSEFFLRTSQKVSFAVRTYLYKCLFSNSRGSSGRRCEQCPAFIKACERNHGQFEVVACFGHLGHEHPTETIRARQLRLEKYRQINHLQYQQRHHMVRSSQKQDQVMVEEYDQQGNSNGVMILVPADEEEEVEDGYEPVIVDDAGDELVRPQNHGTVPQVPRVFIPTTARCPGPGPSSRRY